MKIPGKAAQGVFIACLPFLFFSGSITWAANNVSLYTSDFEKYNVGTVTGLDKGELEKTARGLISYWNSGAEFIDLTVIKDGQPFHLFNEREISHLKDVKALFRFDYAVLFGTLIYALGYTAIRLFWKGRRDWQRLVRGVAWGSALTLASMLAMGVTALLGEEQFARFWLQFHLLSFANDLWQLDPTKDYLLMLVPEGFWFDATRFIVFACAGMAVVFGGAAAGFLLMARMREKPYTED